MAFKSQIASAIVMIIVSVLIFVYLMSARSLKNGSDMFFAAINQFLLAIFYVECLLFAIYNDETLLYFREIFGICVVLTLYTSMIFQLILGNIVFFKMCKHKSRKLKSFSFSSIKLRTHGIMI